jgi:hypothetical protein
MLPFTDREPIRRHETTAEIVIDPGAKPDIVRADLLERAAISVAVALGSASFDDTIVATVEVTLAIRSVGAQMAAETVLPIIIRFDALDDHGEGTADWPPDALLSAVIRNELDRVWRLRRVDEFLVHALGADRRRRAILYVPKSDMAGLPRSSDFPRASVGSL